MNGDLKGRIISYTRTTGWISYFKVVREHENWAYLQEMFTNARYTSCVNKECISKNYDVVPDERSRNEIKIFHDLSDLKLELHNEGHSQDNIDKMIEQLFKNT